MTREFKKAMGQRLKEVMRILDIDEDTLAAALGLSVSTVHNYRTGYDTPSLKVFVKMCEELQISADWLLFGKGDMDA